MSTNAHVHSWNTPAGPVPFPTVTVVILTYNHAHYIVECLRSVLAQRGDFQLDLAIYDDASTDGTATIISSYLDAHRDDLGCRRASLTTRTRNIGVVRGLAQAMAEFGDADYLTFCEGDDFWLTNERIAEHLRFLDQHHECGMSFNAMWLSDAAGEARRLHPDQQRLNADELNGETLAACNVIGNFSSCFYRGRVARRVPPSLFDLYSVDWAFNLQCARFGRIGYLARPLSVYRQHDQGEWSGAEPVARSQRLLALVDQYDDWFGGIYAAGFRRFREALIGAVQVRHGVTLQPAAATVAGPVPAPHAHAATTTTAAPAAAAPALAHATVIAPATGAVRGPLISVLIPSYGHARFLARAIDSVLEQDYPHIELVISDDASPDGSAAVLARYAHLPQVRIHHQPENLGAVENLAFLIRDARGPYIALLNSDDYWLPGKLSRQIALMEKRPQLGACFTWADIVDEDPVAMRGAEEVWRRVFQQPNRTRAQWLRHFFDQGSCLCHPSVLIRSSIYQRLGQYNPFLRQLPDFEFWIRLVKHADIEVIPQSYVIHVRTGGNASALTAVNRTRNIIELEYIYERFFRDLPVELFLEAFGDVLRLPLARMDALHIRCEQLFLLLDGGACRAAARAAALRLFMELGGQSQFASVLARDYRFTSADFFRYTGVFAAGEPGTARGAPALLEHGGLVMQGWQYLRRHGPAAFAARSLQYLRRSRPPLVHGGAP